MRRNMSPTVDLVDGERRSQMLEQQSNEQMPSKTMITFHIEFYKRRILFSFGIFIQLASVGSALIVWSLISLFPTPTRPDQTKNQLSSRPPLSFPYSIGTRCKIPTTALFLSYHTRPFSPLNPASEIPPLVKWLITLLTPCQTMQRANCNYKRTPRPQKRLG